ncbi:hypothetical protein GOBAR_AA36942 [Gossypium barbadense]|uniref:Signal recognition particle 9 kDa protein n=2 Tax=Gossypium TaxID=3633 RepID=A0A2P5VY60_GOSBA|nr:hypothetical protein GOBAR_AA36942 [Gossypium barbadense]
MVYITSWDEFVERTVQLFRADPESTRYCMKYRHCDGKLVLKVTDNKECLKFKTDQAQDARKMEKLNNIFFTLMARGPDVHSFVCGLTGTVLPSDAVDMSEITGKEQEAQLSKLQVYYYNYGGWELNSQSIAKHVWKSRVGGGPSRQGVECRHLKLNTTRFSI